MSAAGEIVRDPILRVILPPFRAGVDGARWKRADLALVVDNAVRPVVADDVIWRFAAFDPLLQPAQQQVLGRTRTWSAGAMRHSRKHEEPYLSPRLVKIRREGLFRHGLVVVHRWFCRDDRIRPAVKDQQLMPWIGGKPAE